MDILVLGFILGGAYALVAMGMTLQYGVARIMNLANGEILILGALASFWFFVFEGVSPLITMCVVAPVAFGVNWAIYEFAMKPLVRRAPNQGRLEGDSILATFGLSFIIVGMMSWIYAEQFAYSFLAEPTQLIGVTVGKNRLVAVLCAVGIGAGLLFWLYRTRHGSAVRAISVSAEAAGLVGINVPKISAFAFALGGAVTAVAGVLLSTFFELDGSNGVKFTMVALIVVIMGGVGDMRGAILAGLLLGVVETTVATLIDPGLTLVAAYALFLGTLLFRPQGLFGRRAS